MVFPKDLNMASGMKSIDDCYFYFYSSCTKGEDCPFRHCQLALGTETVCSLWKEGRCFRNNCKFRHMESRIDRKNIQCYWENQPGGCRKPHCVFFHKKPKLTATSADESKGLILPVSGGSVSPVPSNAASSVKGENSPINSTLTEIIVDETDEGIHSPVEPFVVSFENEESDSESVSSTPVKVNDTKPVNADSGKTNLLSKFNGQATEKLDFEVKSLEQIRLEKIHKESENIYKTDDLPESVIDSYFLTVKRKSSLPGEPLYSYTDYEIPTLEDYKKKRLLSTSEFISLPSENSVVPLDVPLANQNKDAIQGPLKKNNDLRVLLRQSKKKSPVAVSSKVDEPTKKVINFKKQTNQAEGNLDFKIKTLDEIRKEKKEKREMSIQEKKENEKNQAVQMPDSNKSSTIASIPTLRKLKIHRKPTVSLTVLTNVKRKNHSTEGSPKKLFKAESSDLKTVSEYSFSDNVLPDRPITQVRSLLPFLRRSPESSEASLLQEQMESSNGISSFPQANQTPSFSEKEEESHDIVYSPQSNQTSSQEKSNNFSDEIVHSQKCEDDSSLLSLEECSLENHVNEDSSLQTFSECVDSSDFESRQIDTSGQSENIQPESLENNSEASGKNADHKNSPVNRSISIDEIDHFLKDSDVIMGDLNDETVDDGEDDIMLKINEFLDS